MAALRGPLLARTRYQTCQYTKEACPNRPTKGRWPEALENSNQAHGISVHNPGLGCLVSGLSPSLHGTVEVLLAPER